MCASPAMAPHTIHHTGTLTCLPDVLTPVSVISKDASPQEKEFHGQASHGHAISAKLGSWPATCSTASSEFSAMHDATCLAACMEWCSTATRSSTPCMRTPTIVLLCSEKCIAPRRYGYPPVSHVHRCTNHQQQRAKRQQKRNELGCEGARQGQASSRQQAVHRHSTGAGGVKEPAGGCVQPAEGGVPLHVQVGQQQQMLEVPADNHVAHKRARAR
jgi:hypothetical protein